MTKCIYSTLDRTSITLGGVESRKEKCLHSFFYYPRVKNFGYCGSFPTFDDQLNMFSTLKRLDEEIILFFECLIVIKNCYIQEKG